MKGFALGGIAKGVPRVGPGLKMTMPAQPEAVSAMLGKTGICLANPDLGTGSVVQLATVTDAGEFPEAFTGEGDVTAGQELVVKVGENGTRAWCMTTGHNPISELTLQSDKGTVEAIKN